VTVQSDTSARSLGKLADAFSDPTRRAILHHVLEAETPVSAGEVGDVFGVHRTVARAHLEKLVETGLLETATRRRATGGRPAKTYTSSGERLEVMLPPRRYEPLAHLLLDVVGRLAPADMAADHAHAVGHDYGTRVRHEITGNGQSGLRPEAVCSWLNQAGYSARCEHGSDCDAYTFDNCVYREVAVEHPEIICAFDRGMLCGLTGASPERHVQTHNLLDDGFCRCEVRH
jgi:predicted ArsR family transcriptional regulator